MRPAVVDVSLPQHTAEKEQYLDCDVRTASRRYGLLKHNPMAMMTYSRGLSTNSRLELQDLQVQVFWKAEKNVPKYRKRPEPNCRENTKYVCQILRKLASTQLQIETAETIRPFKCDSKWITLETT